MAFDGWLSATLDPDIESGRSNTINWGLTAKRLRETAQPVDGLIPMDSNPNDVPKTLALDYITRGNSFQEGFAARDRKKKGVA